MQFETIAIHAGGEKDDLAAVSPPLYLSTTYLRSEEGEPLGPHSYIREGSPTQERLEEALAAIDGGTAALAFASGMAAGCALLQTLPEGAHVVFPADCYFGFLQAARTLLPRMGVTFSVVDMGNLESVRGAIGSGAGLIWAESPSNPLLDVVDIEGLAEVARSSGAIFLVDGTFATPALQQPLSLGADIVLHSTTKYLGGHSDVQGGALTFREGGELFERVKLNRKLFGAVASPFNSWLVLRGIRSLAARMRVHCENAAAVALFLSTADGVEAVHYPGLSAHPRFDIARKQMKGFGGMLSFRVDGGREKALEVVARTRIFVRATSLGGVESLIEHRASSEGLASTTPQNLIRLSVGLENVGDLIADLAQALRG